MNARVLVSVGLLGLFARAGQAAEPAGTAPPLLLEAHVSHDGPFGTAAVSLAYDGPRLAAGLALGLSDADPGTIHLHQALFARLHLFRWRRLSLALALSASRAPRDHQEIYSRPAFVQERLRWEWRPGYRADAGAAARLDLGSFRLGLDAGVGYLLNRPGCTYQSDIVFFQGSCDDVAVPAPYHLSRPPGRIPRYLGVSVGVRLDQMEADRREGVPAEHPREGGDDVRTSQAWIAPTALIQPARTLTVTLYESMLLDVTYAFSERWQASLGLGFYYPNRGPTMLEANARVQLVRWRRLRGTLVGGLFGVYGTYTRANLVGIGPALSVCPDEHCGSVLSLSTLAGVAFIHPDEGGANRGERGAIVSPSLVVALAKHLKLVAEVDGVAGGDESVWVLAARVPYGPVAIELGVANGDLIVGTLAYRH